MTNEGEFKPGCEMEKIILKRKTIQWVSPS